MSTVQVAEPTLVVHLRGEVDLATAECITRAASLAIANGYRRLVLDLADVEFIDCNGLSALLLARQMLAADGGAFALRNPPGCVRQLLSTAGVEIAVTTS